MSTDQEPGRHTANYEAHRALRDDYHADPRPMPPIGQRIANCTGSGRRIDLVTRLPVCPDCGRTLNGRPGKDGTTIPRHKPEAPARLPVEQALAEVLADEEAETIRAAHDRQARAESIAWSEWARRLVGTDAFAGVGWFGDTEVQEDVLRERIAEYVGALHVACVGWMRRAENAERVCASHVVEIDDLSDALAALDESQARAARAESALAALEEAHGLDPIVAPPEFRPAAPIDDEVERAEAHAAEARRELAHAEAIVTENYGRDWPADKVDDVAAALDERRTTHRLAERRLRQAIERRERH